MGRAFEYRKARKLKRWGNMSRTFTKIGKEISSCVKEAGPDPNSNARLRVLIQNAKAANMPKDNVERAIKKAVSKDFAGYKDMVYEGYGPHGIAILVETQTDNPTRTVANVRSVFTRYAGTLGTSGSLSFIFERKAVFKIKPKEGMDMDELQLELIDLGADDFDQDEEEVIIFGAPDCFAKIQNYLEGAGYELISAEFERFANDYKDVTPEQRETINKMVERLEEDDDVSTVYTNMKEEEGEDEE